MSDQVPEHDQRFTHSYVVHYPAHDPRASDPHKHDFLEWKRRRKENSTYWCDFAKEHRGGDTSECDLSKPLEAHHRVVELAMMNEIDFALLEADYPGISAQEAGAWIDSDANLILLCVTSDSPVLMADGSELPIGDVRPGHEVITKDGTPQVVFGVSRNKYRGDVFTFGRTSLTPTHRLLTDRGWLPVAEVYSQIGMHGPDVISVRCVEHEVARRVVGSITVDVMDALGALERPADQLLYHPSVLHDHAAAGQSDPDVALGGYLSSAYIYGLAGARLPVKCGHPASVRTVIPAVPDQARPELARRTAHATVHDDTAGTVLDALPMLASAVPGTARVSFRQGFRDKELLLADDARPRRQRRSLAYGWWDTLREIRKVSYSGWVHDLIVPHNKSFVSSGIVVHNCVNHHRGPMGVHTASASDYGSEFYVLGLISKT